ncbi:hypothetical protein HanRHA438_Chr04g0157031 [Helianthus annuus]|nr:hypothetical protein HanRHA438_Chr04g0157031 [Helianthus annuus]
MDSSFTLFLTLTIIITPPPPPFSPPLTAFSDHVSGDLSAARLVPLNRLLFPITFQVSFRFCSKRNESDVEMFC